MKILFFGNGDFGIPSLDVITKSKNIHSLTVITNHPKRAGRGLKNKNTPIHDFCIKSSINFILNDDLNDENFKKNLYHLKPDLFVVISYKILPKDIFSLPRLGSINLHPSLLPKYRGASPIQYSIFNGDKLTGVTIFKLSSGIDSGKILFQKEIEIPKDIIFSDLYEMLSKFGADAVKYSLDNFTRLNNSSIQQNIENVSKAPKINKNDRVIRWNNTDDTIYNKIRGLSLKPGAITRFNNKDLLITSVEKTDISSSYVSGTMYNENDLLYISTNTNSLLIKNLKVSGKKTTTSKDFISGYGSFLPQTLDG